MNKLKYELIVTIINRGQADRVVESARKAGATGGTIIYGRGTSKNEKNSIFGISIEPEKELIFTLVKCEERNKIMNAICEGAELNKAGVGICFTLPVTNIKGVTKIEKEFEQLSLNLENKEEQKEEPKE